jgi:hypothetical protein
MMVFVTKPKPEKKEDVQVHTIFQQAAATQLLLE